MDRPARPDEGFGLVEVMVSMMLFALVLLMTIGLLVTALKASARNSTIASATQWAAEQIDSAHTAVAGLDHTQACSKWTTVVSSPVPPDRKDGRGKAMRMVITADATPSTCTTSSVPPVVSYTVKVVEASAPSKVLATATTRVALGLE